MQVEGGIRPDRPGTGRAETSSGLQTRRYRSGDETAIIELYEQTFGRPMGETESLRHWRWEFLENPAGRQAILLTYSGDRLAAQYAVLPLRVRMDGVVHGAALSLDTATDKAFRGQGLFPRMARQLYAELAAEGSMAVFGFPNAMSAPTFFNRLGWVELGPFPLLLKPLRGAMAIGLAQRGWWGRAAAPLGEWVAALFRKPPRSISSAISVEETSSFPEDTDALWQRACAGKRVCVVRDRPYLEWRYRCNPDHPYRIWVMREQGRLVGSLVTRVDHRFGMRCGFVMDLLCEESRLDVARSLVRLAEIELAKEDVQLLSALMYPGTAARRALREGGFWPVPPRWFPQPIHFGVLALSPDADRQLLHDPTNWYITWGDSDVV